MEPNDLKYHKEHEWIRVEGQEATLGITNFAQDALGDVVFIQMPKIGASVSADQEISEVESTKATSSVYTPVSGTIAKINEELNDHPELLNKDPYGQGWIAVITLSNPNEVDTLMTAAQYEEFLKSQEQ